MKHRSVHLTIGVLTGFTALTAIGGGMAILTGLDRFPLAWLAGTPFSDYTIPALLLVIGVGGSALIAAVTIFSGCKVGVPASMLAGLILAGYIVMEVLLLKQVPPGPTWIEIVYFGLGGVVFVLAAWLRLAAHRQADDG